MKHDDTDFTRAWNSLTTSGEMSGEPPRPFTPVGLRKDVQRRGRSTMARGRTCGPAICSRRGTPPTMAAGKRRNMSI